MKPKSKTNKKKALKSPKENLKDKYSSRNLKRGKANFVSKNVNMSLF